MVRKIHWGIAVLAVASCAALGCAGNAGAPPTPQGVAPPQESRLSQIALGQNDFDVRRILGEPHRATAYQTGKDWIPFYFGPDTHRMDWIYAGEGRVVFSRNRYSGELKVVRIDHDPGAR